MSMMQNPFRAAIVAAAMLGFSGAQRLDARALQVAGDMALVNSGRSYTVRHRHRAQPGQGRGVGSKLAKRHNTTPRGW